MNVSFTDVYPYIILIYDKNIVFQNDKMDLILYNYNFIIILMVFNRNYKHFALIRNYICERNVKFIGFKYFFFWKKKKKEISKSKIESKYF